MKKKALLILFVAFFGFGKLFAQLGNPPIHVPDLSYSLTICLDAMDVCRQVSCSGGQCVTVPAHSPGIYYANPGSGCLAGAGRNCPAWRISFTQGPGEYIASDEATDFVLPQAIGWTNIGIIGPGGQLSFMWDGSSFYIQN
ncbi:hypothetical protein DBR32_00330 [Taibaiella sp. KBW10]|uniref:hypothetical protein n=1 Tax=Taibaiella sp. KBW10 TaxID=2153357 RepID=UPI000F592D80|nr:hypothetical protein [Taibaiella sp. KBW10]RQO32095.1 hypothetical protein DBR32_00330 [Taibaiella sp. KBW10]